jgi:hypothetical protein
MANTFEQEDIRTQAEQLTNLVLSDQFRSAVAEAAAYPEEQRKDAAARIVSVENLRSHGLDIPPGLRISPRVFEPPAAGMLADSPEVVAHTATPLGVCVSLGVYLCVSWGG